MNLQPIPMLNIPNGQQQNYNKKSSPAPAIKLTAPQIQAMVRSGQVTSNQQLDNLYSANGIPYPARITLAQTVNGGNANGQQTVQNNAAPALQYDPAAALRATQGREAQGIKDRILGRGGEVDSILSGIMASIDGLLGDKKKLRQGQYDSDSAALIDSLNAAIPEIQKAFAALGLSSSTFVGDRVDNTNQEYVKSQQGVDQQLDADLANYGQWAESEKSNANASAAKAKNTLDFVSKAGGTAENLSRLQESELSFNNALTDFGAAKNNYTTSGDAMAKLNAVGSDYDFSKILDSFGSLAASSANTGTGGGAAQTVADSIRGLDPKNKKKLTEAQVNTPVGAATA